MGGGGLLQLVAYGAQDVFLTGNAQITFFKALYRRHTNFAIEAIEQTFIGVSQPGGRSNVVISRNGDLIHKVYLQVELPASASDHLYVNKLGFALIDDVEVEIGGQKIDRISSRWMDAWHSFTARSEKAAGFAEMTLVDPTLNPTQGFHLHEARKLYIPINFWFSKGSAGAALPLIALQYHEVKLIFNFAKEADFVKKGTIVGDGTLTPWTAGSVAAELNTPDADTTSHDIKFTLFADFIFLDTAERRRFAQTSHEYLIEQVQTTGPEAVTGTGSHKLRLTFNHPCKAFYWCFVPNEVIDGDASASLCLDPFFNGVSVERVNDSEYHSASANPIKEVRLQLNGHERFKERDGTYFQLVQPYQHHTTIPTKSFYGCYSFCLAPEEHQPSGALNMSRVDNASITFTMADSVKKKAGNFHVWALNYNVLRILSGMGGLAFSN